MKNVIILLLVLIIPVPVLATAFFEPQWNEFCPNKYINLDPDKEYVLSEKVYWQQRKKDFDKKVGYCKKMIPEQRVDCYNNLRQIESNASATHIQEIKIKQQEYANAANMMNAVNYQTNTMYNIMSQPIYHY